MIYCPKDEKEITLVYDAIPGQEETFNQEGIETEINITDILENNRQTSFLVYEALLEKYGKKWADEIRDHNETIQYEAKCNAREELIDRRFEE